MMSEREEFLEICERSLKKCLSQDSGVFDVGRSILMLECHIICQKNLDNHDKGDIICYLCASICVDCLDPKISLKAECISGRWKEMHRYLKGQGPICQSIVDL